MDDQVTPFEQTQQFHDVLSAAHEFLLNRIEDQHLDVASWSHETAAKYVSIETATFVQEWRIPVNESEMHKVAVALVKEVTGFGPLDDLLADGEVEDILVNGYENVYASRHGILQREPVRFSDNRHVVRIVRRILAPLGRRLDEANPMVDARLANGGRLNAIIEPLSVTGPTVSIRKFRQDPFTPEQLVGNGTFDRSIHALLQAAVASRCNILISGGTSSGKTSLLNALASFIPDAERVITIEDTAELSLSHPHVVRLESRLGGFDGGGAVGIRELVRNSLRMRPDRIVVGEVRGAEVLEMLQAMNTGHDGSMSTVHANSPRDALYRLEMLVGFAGFQGSEDSLRRQIASAIDFVVQIARLSSGRRVITSVTEVTGVSDKIITTQEMYRHETRVGSDGKEQDRWPGLGFHPNTRKLEPFRQFLQDAVMESQRQEGWPR
ncbi:Pilus assembly protein CpaF [Rhodanobacter sp. Root179]|jgi:pilus assembly protein CpaF|uniref:CpaF family protein n=1 Tax=unclassified Rhodanobacter TaxID=2621553 RepID=UPI0006F784BA|nr:MULTISPECIES: CpaF family protein [unclassified Rhodanobacter]KQZ79376.1 pilus assembly protein CpaF [Rhodanobacter sp. Root561]KRB40776.1 pilus assembly protein CpaF [Rhodanobacter sp. Root179]